MRADCICSKCLAKAFTFNGFTSSVMQCFIWRDAWGNFRMDTECKNNRACHNKLSQENTNGNSLAVGCFKRRPWIMLLQSSIPLQSARSIWELQILDCWEHLCWFTLILSTGGAFNHLSNRVLLMERAEITNSVPNCYIVLQAVFYNEMAKVQPASEIALCCSQSFHHCYKKEDPAVNTVSSCIAPFWTEIALPTSRQYARTRNLSITTRSIGICLTRCSTQVPDKLANRNFCTAKFESLCYTK